jgi:transposase-like protein
LTLKADELGESYCPECFEEHGKKRYNFVEIAATDVRKPQFKCEECGIMII